MFLLFWFLYVYLYRTISYSLVLFKEFGLLLLLLLLWLLCVFVTPVVICYYSGFNTRGKFQGRGPGKPHRGLGNTRNAMSGFIPAKRANVMSHK